MSSVVILGAGYGGLRVALRLSATLGNTWSVTVVERSACHQLITRLPELVAGVIEAGRACIPYERLIGKNRRIRLLRGEVHNVDPVTLKVETSEGAISADRLVVALGSVSDFQGVPGAEELGLVLKSVAGAVALQSRIEQLCARQGTVHVTIVGAGYTGTELAGELTQWNRDLRRAGGAGRLEVTVVAQDERLLPEGNERFARVAERVLRRKGVSMLLGTGVAAVEKDRIVLQSGLKVPSDVVVWAAKTRPAPQLHRRVWHFGRDGRIDVDPYLRAQGHERVYVVGDAAHVYDYRLDKPAPASAQLAVAEGDIVARNIYRETRGLGLLEYQPRILGEALSLGGADGAAEVAGVVVTGRTAVAAKEAALARYLYRLGGPSLVAQYR